MKTLREAITWNELKLLLPVLVGLSSIIFFTAGLSAKIDAVAERAIDAKLQQQKMADTIERIKDQQNTQSTDIAIIKSILQHNGLTLAPIKQNVASVVPSTLTYVYIQPASTPVPTPTLSIKATNTIDKLVPKLKK